MRAIKFRGKALHNGVWHYGYLSEISTLPLGEVGEIRSIHEDCVQSTIVKAETIGQFTGVTDIYGKEIYEGDILALYFENHCTWKVAVLFEYNGFQVKRKDGRSTFLGQKPWEIIGNIYDNPELLEKDYK